MMIYKTLECGIELVEYEDSIAQAVADMWNSSQESWGGGTNVRTAEQVMDEMARGSFFNVFIALDKGEAVGFLSFDRYYKDADTAYVHVLNVRPDYHGKKVGKALLHLAMEKTIEMGLPRVDLHTWPGNTKAVPLYKKCGYFWADRADTTHLSNYLPTLFTTELIADFFKKADWYNDSTRVIEIKPDGEKINKFELFMYSWEKDGEVLKVGMERNGRRIRYIETNDYIVDMTAENHELAFGLSYNTNFKVTNKSGKELNLEIKGKNDKQISFDYNIKETIVGTKEFSSEFSVGAVDEEQDIFRMHPCVLADIYINGKCAEFGLGINIKYPLEIRLNERKHIYRTGITEDVLINVKSLLNQNAKISFVIPDNSCLKFNEPLCETNVNSKKTVCVEKKAIILAYDYAACPVEYNITLENGKSFSYTKPLHLANRGMTGRFAYEDQNDYVIINGPWALRLYKFNNQANLSNISNNYWSAFNFPKLGKPYSDEFNLSKPSDVRTYTKDDMIYMEADYKSTAFNGIMVTSVFYLSATGLSGRSYKVQNISAKPISVSLIDEYYLGLGNNTEFAYDGEIMEIKDNYSYGFSNIDKAKFDDNWIFEKSESGSNGYYWDKEYTPTVYWGNALSFEHDIKDLTPNAIFETKPFNKVIGYFTNHNDFRDYACGTHTTEKEYTSNHVDVIVNNNNPFVTEDTFGVDITNNRLQRLEGKLSVKCTTEQTQENSSGEITKVNNFNIDIKNSESGILPTDIIFDTLNYYRENQRVVFKPSKTEVEQFMDGSSYVIDNGVISFRNDPKFSTATYSLMHNETEWFLSMYPEHKPFGWVNPFIGGIFALIGNMKNTFVVREEIKSEFVEVSDNFGNKWTGYKSFVSIDKYDELKDVAYEEYAVTMPGLPVLCHFVRVINKTGGFFANRVNTNSTFSTGDLKDTFVEATERNRKNHLHLGTEDVSTEIKDFAKISCGRKEALYIYNDYYRNNGNNGIYGDNKTMDYYQSAQFWLKHGESSCTRPTFIIISDKCFKDDAFTDLSRVQFDVK